MNRSMGVLEHPRVAAERADGGTRALEVVLVDDHAVVRMGLRLVLEADGVEVVGEAGDLDTARTIVAEHQPDVLVLDVHLGAVTGLTLLEEMPQLAPHTRTVVLTMQNEAAFVREALAAGARGYVLKDGAFSELLSAVNAASSGGNYVSPELGARLAVNDGSAHLSPRELEVLRLIALGFTNGEVAERLFLSVRTVESHRAHVQDKLGVKTRHELVEYALSQGLLPRPAAYPPNKRRRAPRAPEVDAGAVAPRASVHAVRAPFPGEEPISRNRKTSHPGEG